MCGTTPGCKRNKIRVALRVLKVGGKTEYPVLAEITRSCEPKLLNQAPLTITTQASGAPGLELGCVYVLCGEDISDPICISVPYFYYFGDLSDFGIRSSSIFRFRRFQGFRV